eukprot:TRINITY_DN62955_c0_g1_i1.p1 TRINITY_DN62955_c0_g1~~TRINITY_DN62955_c0_g1_i1.p1  ORF type:complete len:143 (+),score=20.37 TRINITY_DN62955_c0_g1_i1:182-610(+)
MLNYSYPNLMQINGALDNFSTRRRLPTYTISKSERFPPPPGTRSKSVVNLSPGMYKTDTTLPASELDINAYRTTRAISTPKFSFGRDNRCAPDEFLKGISPSYRKDISALGPGQYPVAKMGNRVNKRASPMYSVPRSVSYDK